MRRVAGVGLLGGTFDPIHLAHLRLAEAAREALDLERVYFIPAAVPALKPSGGVTDAAHRLEMVRRATRDNGAFGVLDLELKRSGPSYTVDTLRELQATLGDRALWFLMGSDALATLDQWREPHVLLGLTNIGVVSRAGTAIEQLSDWLPASLARDYAPVPGDRWAWRHGSGHHLRWIELESLEIASSQVRALLRAGHSARYLVPDSVLAYVEENRLYRENS